MHGRALFSLTTKSMLEKCSLAQEDQNKTSYLSLIATKNKLNVYNSFRVKVSETSSFASIDFFIRGVTDSNKTISECISTIIRF